MKEDFLLPVPSKIRILEDTVEFGFSEGTAHEHNKARIRSLESKVKKMLELLKRQNDANEFDGHGPVQEIREFLSTHETIF